MAPHLWRQRVETVISEMVSPEELAWMDDDESLSVSHICNQALEELQARFQRPLQLTTDADRILLAERLFTLPCLLAQCNQTDCPSQTANNKYLTLVPTVTVFTKLLDGPSNEVTHQVKMKVFQAISRFLDHHSSAEDLAQVLDLIFAGLGDSNRSTRLSAGKCLDSFIRSYEIRGQQKIVVEGIFARLYQLFETSKTAVRETMLVTVASIGRRSSYDTLGQVLGLIIAQLGRQNPVIRGSACMQILSLSKHHKKAPYLLLLPYQDKIAPFIIERLPVQPDLLSEACRVMSSAPSDFINITLPYTLPIIFASCNQGVLDLVSREVPEFPKVLINHFPTVLSHIFLLPSQAATTKGLNFVAKVVSDATKTTVTVQSVVKVSLVSLLGNLVMKMGDDDRGKAEMAIEALQRVQNELEVGSKKPFSTPSLGDFLRIHMLGLISNINDVLQDVQGKKSPEMKRKLIRGLGTLIEQIGEPINHVSPQIMATFQTMVGIPELSEATMESWHKFLITLAASDVGPHIGPTSAAIVSSWNVLSLTAQEMAYQALDFLIGTDDEDIRRYLCDVADISVIKELRPLADQLRRLRGRTSPKDELQRILGQSASDNLTVVGQALHQLKAFLLAEGNRQYLRESTSGDMFSPIIGDTIACVLSAACRDSGDDEYLTKQLAFECLGVLGAIDPDRCEIDSRSTNLIILKNFTDEEEATVFALHLIQDLLVGAFRSTSDIKYQNNLAYSIQELLKLCRFTPAVVSDRGSSVSVKTRKLWASLPKHVLETVTPLLESKYFLSEKPSSEVRLPIYPNQSTYREWIQVWATDLISKASVPMAQKVFSVFRSAVRSKDVIVAYHLLPHLVLHVLISGNGDHAHGVRTEIITVLQDQVDVESTSTSDKKLLSAQASATICANDVCKAVFMLLDHLNKWVRAVRQDLSKKEGGKRSRANIHPEEQLSRLDSILSNIDQTLMAKAAFKCKAYARSLMNFEQQIVTILERGGTDKDLPEYYERLHEIYAQLDEPDGMEGISTMILSPTLEHQIRQHESTGRWTSAQSCWEVRLQESPNNVEFHVGLLRCLRNLGHYDTLRTHVAGVLTRHPDWEATLAGFQAESAWMIGAWEDVKRVVERNDVQTSSMVLARVLLAMREGNQPLIDDALSRARIVLGAPIAAAGVGGYRRAYDAALDLHLTHELELIYATTSAQSESQEATPRRRMADLSKTLTERLDFTLPTFRSREQVLSMRRTAFALASTGRSVSAAIGKSWLASAKIARKARQWQTAYSAVLQAQKRDAPYSFIESAKLLKASGDPLRALNELENSSNRLQLFDKQFVDLTGDTELPRMKAKILILRARWMDDTDRFDDGTIYEIFKEAAAFQRDWESAHYYLGLFHDECFKKLSSPDRLTRGPKMIQYTIRAYVKAIMNGSKFVYQTVPRMLTIWLDMGENKKICHEDSYKKMTEVIAKAFREAPAYKWFTAFPQIVSRVGHENLDVYRHLERLMITVLETYPRQALWLFMAVVKSTKENRYTRGKQILQLIQGNPRNSQNNVQRLVKQSLSMTQELLKLCDATIDETKYSLNMSKDFSSLKRLGKCDLIIPLQESLIASLPPTPQAEGTHYPFPLDTPTFQEFADEIEVMKSLAKPRKITIKGSNGQTYMFLGKPKDDLRKDARLMDFNAIINKLLKGSSESRRRQLHIRTYGVVTLNEECGFIQWVPNTIPIRPILIKSYDARQVKPWTGNMSETFKKIKETGLSDKQCADLFQTKILTVFMPIFHEWFIETFPEPTAWLASRLTYGRTAAVMSMVGYILGLGDRHCENILMDMNSGDVVHVDFNCLFEKGKQLETPERVPFRLTQNMVDGLGVSGVEGVFRMSCELTMQLLRDNRELLMSVLDAFVHDPLVEWEDEKRKIDLGRQKHANVPKVKADLRELAKAALNPIEKKLRGIHSNNKERNERELSTSNFVQMLIQEATDLGNLSRMYPGWAPWH
ncbi:hypothetical protein CPB83DRAFT_754578 [Crepidotus variabilis]|uniref:non-specific serine/threonine protein kinase n=1 Tax=Crepidotus variabilis TaxID=179855 RepID=A0A9P6EST0_9AGAR|nr:hypothetical protein CPB83DRAFT_754578 [Crepidotus variabilis]